MNTLTNDNWDFSNPEHQRAYIRRSNLEFMGKEKVASPLAGLTDLGIALTPEEERDVHAYAERMEVSFDKIAEDVAATYIVISDRKNTKLHVSLVKRMALPRNLLAECIKRLIYMEAMRCR